MLVPGQVMTRVVRELARDLGDHELAAELDSHGSNKALAGYARQFVGALGDLVLVDGCDFFHACPGT